MLDYASEDINGMDGDVEAEPGQNLPITGRWTTTSTYDVYMVDTPEKKDDDCTQDPDEDKPVDEPPKCQHQRWRSRSRRERERNTSIRENDTPDNAEDPENPVEPAFEKDEREEGQFTQKEFADREDSEDSNYLPVSEEDVSLSDEDFIVPENPSNKNASSDSSSPPREA